MMGISEGHGHSVMHVHGRIHDREDFQGAGRHLGHMRGTAEGPPGLRPDRAETSKYVEGAKKGDDADAVQSRLSAEMAGVFDSVDGDGDGMLNKGEFYNFTELVVRDGLASLLARIGAEGAGGDGDGGDDGAVDATPPAADDGGASGAVVDDPTGGVAAPPAPDANVAVEQILPLAVEQEVEQLLAEPAVVVDSGDPVFDLTLSSVAETIVETDGAETALALLDAAQGYAEAAAAA